MKPRVFRSWYTLRWAVMYGPGQIDWFDTWSEAIFRAYWWVRIHRNAAETMKGLRDEVAG